MQELKLTKRTIETIPHTGSGQAFYRDTLLKGFGLRVGTKSKMFFVEGQVNKKTRRVTIGRADVLSVDEARKRALLSLGEMAGGTNPNEERRRQEAENITLKQAFEDFFEARTHLSPYTVAGYERTPRVYLKAWRTKRLNEITKKMVMDKHRQITKHHGGTTANNVFRHFRSVYNFIAALHEDFPTNPVTVLSSSRSWHKERRRTTVIPRHRLADWWSALSQEQDYARVFFQVALFTGMRRIELMHLRWEFIDLEGRTLHIPNTKNGDPLDLPLSSFLLDLLMEWRLQTGNSEWVFPGMGKTGHLVEIKKAIKRVSEASGVKFTTHDLRRTFITIAESLDVPYYALKRMLNHRTDSDVTGGYIVIDVERLRGSVEQVAQNILELADVSDGRQC